MEEFVGRQIRGHRKERGMSQAELGAQLAGKLAGPWPRQAVCVAEQGARALGVAEIVALAAALDVDVADLVEPSSGLVTIELPGGLSVDLRASVPGNPETLKREARDLERRIRERTAANFEDAVRLGEIEREMRGATAA